MNILETITGANSGELVSELARQLQLDETQTREAVGQLAPAVARGIRREAATPSGLESLLGALSRGDHRRYVDEPELLGRQESVADGNGILGHIFGSKDVSRNVAARAAEETGLDIEVLKKLLPMLAAAAMGALGTQAASPGAGGGLGDLLGGALGGSRGSDPGLADVLSRFLDTDHDGNALDDVLDLAKRFF